MKYGHIIHYFNSSPWAILPEKLHAIMELIELRIAGVTLTDPEIEARIGPQEKTEPPKPTAVAVIPVRGTISHRASMLRRSSGGTSVEEFAQDFRAAVRSPDVGAVVLDIDSPGGSTAGIEEIADEIHAARSKKRIVAAVNSLGASAAYWMASSAHEIAVTPSGHVGSIGVLGVHMDQSERTKAEGVRVSIVSAGKFKAEGNEFGPLTNEARAHLQAIVDDRYDAFVRAVARGRGVALKAVREGFGEGRLVTAKDALAMGMVDSVETIESTISRTVGRAARARTIAEQASWEIARTDGEEVLTAVMAALKAGPAPVPEPVLPVAEIAKPNPALDPSRLEMELLELG